jgi:RNA polymerase sigma-70 factor (ECF subfamily)
MRARPGPTPSISNYGKAKAPVTSSRDKGPFVRADHSALIVAIAQNQDRAAFAHLFEYFAPRLKALLTRLGASPGRAEEVAQDTMLAVWSKARLFDPAGASASGWIYRIAKNLYVDELRRDRRSAAATVAAPILDDDVPPQPDAIVSARHMEVQVRAAIAALSAEQLRVITLSFFEEKPHAEIAKELSIPLGTVKSRVRLAMQRLRDLLDDQ